MSRLSIQLGNILRGATDTKREKISTLASLLVTVKTPTFIDISHYDPPSNWSLIPKSVILLGTKATEGTAYRDPTFPDIFTKAKTILGVNRLAYHFFRKALNPITQANWFIDYIDPYLDDTDILTLDFEEGGETANQLYDFWNRVVQRKPRNQIMNYSRKLLMDAVTMTSSQKAFFKTIPSWVAGYPTDPNPYNTTPAGYIPDPTRWGAVWAWQYTDNGQLPGFTAAVDLNLIEKPLLDYIGAEVPGDTHVYPYEGWDSVKLISGTRNGWKFWLYILDPARVRFEVHTGALETVPSVAERKGAPIGVNASDWARDTGQVIYEPGMPAVMFYGGSIDIFHQDLPPDVQKVYCVRYILKDGVIPSYLSGSEPQYTEGHSRTIGGKMADGRMMIFISEGVYPNQGLTLYECATIIKNYGGVTAGDWGGGGDTTLVVKSSIINVTENILNGVHFNRPIPQQLLIYPNGGSMINGKAKEALGKTSTVRTSPGVVSGNSTNLTIAPYSEIEFTEIVNGINSASDRWFKLPTGNYVQYIYAGKTYYDIISMPDDGTPPPPPADDEIKVFVNDVLTVHMIGKLQ